MSRFLLLEIDMYDMGKYCLLTIVGFTCMIFADARMSSLECTPEKGFNLSPIDGYGRFEEILSGSSGDKSSSASIRCKITGREDFLAAEWILVGEPPSFLTFDAEKELLSSLHETTVICSASDIPHINRPGPLASEKRYVNGNGTVSYQCDGTEHLKITFNDMHLLSQDLTNLVGGPGDGKLPKDECIKQSKMPEGELSSQVGTACRGHYRYMYDEEGNLTCAKCCSDYYWSTSENQCQKCTGVTTNLEPNIWTSCKDERESEPTSSTTILPTTSTSVAVLPPSSTPQNVKITDVGTNFVIFNWEYPSSDPVDKYVVSIQDQLHNTSAENTHLKVDHLTPYTKYTMKMRAENQAGPGPWTEPLNLQTKGTAPTRHPSNVTITCSEHHVTVTWDPIVGTRSGDEEPIRGVKIYYYLAAESSEQQTSVTSVSSSAEFTVEQDGDYKIILSCYNERGDGPSSSYQTCCDNNQGHPQPVSGWAAFGYSLLMIFLECGFFAIINACLTCRDRRRGW